MTIKEFADMLNGREYLREITHAECEEAKALGYIVVFGSSDDLCEFRGAIRDEIDCWNGGIIYIADNKILEPPDGECKDINCPYFKAAMESAKTIEAVWRGGEYAWIYKTDIPHETFSIYEDGDTYCRGIVFEIKDLE